jgi:Tol biopolymer transport system component
MSAASDLALTPGARLGAYEIAGKLGEGGMGEVWRATDTRLGRQVALKILPVSLADDGDRHARFEREAKVLASLNHANIATLYGLEHLDGRHVLVMEMVEGEDLSERLGRGAVPVDEALGIAMQIAEALEAAHEKGIVHRDLKPANVKVTPAGVVKVLDFGLAKALDPALASGSAANPATSPTMATTTQAGLILGTAAYMAPEQARGSAVDKRADIWAFGVVLFEMLTGRRLFAGATVSDTLAAVLRQEIDWRELPGDTPPAVRRLLARCLARDRTSRLRDIGDARLDLEEPWSGREPTAEAAAAPSRPLAGVLAAGLAGAALTLGVVLLVRPGGRVPRAAAQPTFRQVTILPGGELTPAISPDGESFVYAKTANGDLDLFLQRVDGSNPIELTADCREDDRDPAFSPDGRRIAYRSDCGGGGIFVMGATGESARRATDFGYMPSWSPDGREVVVATERPGLPTARPSVSHLWAVNVETGVKRLVTEHDAMHPSWSPDGSRIAFWGLRGDTPQRDLWTVAADGSQTAADAAVPVTDDPPLDWNPVWAPDGRSLYFSSTRGGTFNLWRIAVEPASGHPEGAPAPVTAPTSWAGWISVSRDGRRLLFVDRNARTAILRAPLAAGGRGLAGPLQEVPLGSFEVHNEFDLSPDGESVIFATAGLPQNLFVVRGDGSGLRQLTDGAHRDRQAAWSPDGSWIVFQTDRFRSQFARVRPDGSGLRELATGLATGWHPTWSSDGRRIAASAPNGGFLIDPEASSPEAASTFLPAAGDGFVFWPSSWSPDDRVLAGTLYRDGAPAGIGTLSLAEGRHARLAAPDGASRPQFLSEGRHLLAASPDRLVLLDTRGAPAADLAAARPGHRFTYAAVSADRRWVSVFDAADESDVWLATIAAPGAAAQR